MKSSTAVVSTVGNSLRPIAMDHRVADLYGASSPMQRVAEVPARVPDYVVDVSRPVVPWRWTSVLLTPLELLAAAWSIPFIVLVIGIPIALAAALVVWAGRFLLSYF